MANSYFIKLYMEILDDPKIYQLRPTLRWRFIECLLMAGEQRDSGYLPETDKMAWRLRDDPEKVETDLAELGEVGLLDLDNGCWHVRQFSKRQARQYSDNPDAVRQREYRERKRKEAKEKEDKIKIKDVDEDMSHVTVTRDMSHGNVTYGNNRQNQQNDPMIQPAITQLVSWWLQLVGGSLPSDTEVKRSKLFEPAGNLLRHLDGDMPRAKDLLKQKRTHMLEEGKTPKWLEAMVPYIVADRDTPQHQEKEFWET
jgi:hypothetical protein